MIDVVNTIAHSESFLEYMVFLITFPMVAIVIHHFFQF